MRAAVFRILGVLFIIALIGFGVAPAVGAQTDVEDRNDIVVVTGGAEVDVDEEADTVVVIDGNIVIAGSAKDSVVAFNGDILVTGTVEDDVVAVNGRVTVAEGGSVGGDVASSDQPVVNGTVGGEIRDENFGDLSAGASIALRVAWWIAVTASTLVLGLAMVALLPRAVGRATEVFKTQPGPVIGWGLVVAIAVPIISVLAFITLLGIPLSLMMLALLAGFAAVGYVTAMHIAGRMALPAGTNTGLAFLAGWLVFRLIDLIPFLGGLVTAVAALIGLGALAVAGWRAGHGPEAAIPFTAADEDRPTQVA